MPGPPDGRGSASSCTISSTGDGWPKCAHLGHFVGAEQFGGRIVRSRRVVTAAQFGAELCGRNIQYNQAFPNISAEHLGRPNNLFGSEISSTISGLSVFPAYEMQDATGQEMTLSTEDKVIIVAYHLPLRIDRKAGGYTIEWDDERGIDKASMGLPMRCTYIGCIELEVPDVSEQEALEKLLFEQYDCIVIFLDPELKHKYYHRFCRLYLAPVMHNQMHVMEDVDPFQPDEWRAYCVVNQLFASKVMEVYSGEEMVWVHDYHLMLTPSCIVRKLHLAKIGFFMHAPFPASDVWRTVVVRLELLRSLLNVDLVGFLMFECARHLLHTTHTTADALRMLASGTLATFLRAASECSPSSTSSRRAASSASSARLMPLLLSAPPLPARLLSPPPRHPTSSPLAPCSPSPPASPPAPLSAPLTTGTRGGT